VTCQNHLSPAVTRTNCQFHREAIKADFQSWITSKIWPLSCYNPTGATFLFEDLKDVSFEEARAEAYKAIASGTKDAFIEGFNAEMLKVKNIIETVAKMDNQSLLGLIKTNTGTPAVINSHSSSTSVFGATTSTTNAFGAAKSTANAFGSTAPTSTANAFGAASTFGSTSSATNNPFAANTASTAGNIFAQPAQSSNIFATSQATFGQSTPAFGTAPATFGATPALPAAQPLGQTAPTSSVFGQSAAPAAFGQAVAPATFGQAAPATSFGQVASSNPGVFGQPAQSTASSNPFASQPSQSQFGVVAQTAPQTTAFGQPAASATFGQQPAAGLFGQPAATTPTTFGQPATSAPSTFGQPSAASTGFGQPTASTGFGQPSAPNTAHIQPAQSGFGLAAPAPVSGFGAVAAKPQAVNPFGSSQPKQEAPPAPKSELIPDLTELCITQYKLEQFTVGMIPECPPPPELCA